MGTVQRLTRAVSAASRSILRRKQMSAGAFTRHSWQETCAVRFVRLSMGEFCRLVRRTVEGLPERFQPYLENVVVDVELEPSDEHWERVEGRDDL